MAFNIDFFMQLLDDSFNIKIKEKKEQHSEALVKETFGKFTIALFKPCSLINYLS